MGHNIMALGTASLDTMGGLITLADAVDLPEGASPRCWDVDFIVGSVLSRPGLQSIYSYAGSDAGPSLGNTASSSGSGNAWANISGVLGNTSFASVTTASTTNTGAETPNSVVQRNVNGWTWSNPSNLVSLVSPATVTLTNNSLPSKVLFVSSSSGFSIPSTATIQGIQINFKGSASAPTNLSFQLIQPNGQALGIPTNVLLPLTTTALVAGSPTFIWGANLTPALINGSSFGVNVQATLANGASTASIAVNSMTVTVYYVTGTGSNALAVEQFGFSLPSTVNPTGFTVGFTASYSGSAPTTIEFQLLKAGVPVGAAHTQVLTTSPTHYNLGSALDLWSSTWQFSDVNNTDFGVQIIAVGNGTTQVKDVQITSWFTAASENFNYVKSYEQNNGGLFTLALDAAGILWYEDVVNNPGVLNSGLTGILPGSFARSNTAEDQEYICFSNVEQAVVENKSINISIGSDRPRVVSENINGTGLQYLPLSQVGPGAPPVILATQNTGNVLVITAFTINGSGLATFTINSSSAVSNGDLLFLSGFPSGSAFLNGLYVQATVSGSGPYTSFTAIVAGHNGTSGSGLSASASPRYTVPIASLTQPPQNPQNVNWVLALQSTGPLNVTTPGNVCTIYYGATSQPGEGPGPDMTMVNMLSAGIPVFVQITGSQGFNGVWQVTSHSYGQPPLSDFGHHWWYFTFQALDTKLVVQNANQGSSYTTGGNGQAPGVYQITYATLTTSFSVPGAVDGASAVITGTATSPGGWNSTWTIENSTSWVLNITQTDNNVTNANLATYQFTVASGTTPAAHAMQGYLVQITGCTNHGSLPNTPFNVTGTVIDNTSSEFWIDIGLGSLTISPAAEAGQAQVYGKSFNFDPGAAVAPSTTANAIFGNESSGGGYVSIAGQNGNNAPIGTGIRQAVCFFITESGYQTSPSIPVTFTVDQNANSILVSGIPIGPANVVGRGIAFTEAGQNGTPGANFYVISQPVSVVVNGQTVNYTSTIINDNVSTAAQFSFTDSVLLNGDEIDVQGNDLFNLIELGSPAWVVPYASRNFYGLMLNKLDNFINMSFDGGYYPGVLQPLGWNIGSSLVGGSPVTISSFSITSNVVTFQAVNGYAAGQQVVIDNLTTPVGLLMNGITFTVLATGLSTTQFEASTPFFTHANVTNTTDAGTATSVNQGAGLITSPVTGMALYIKDTVEGVSGVPVGYYSQGAYQDAYGVPIILANTTYSIRVACSNPSGIAVGTLVFKLFDKNTNIIYGTFNVPLSTMSSVVGVFTGPLLSTPFTQPIVNNNPPGAVPSGLTFAFYVSGMGFGSDVLLDRMEIFETQNPFILAQVFGSYIGSLESIDASDDGGIINTTTENQQPCVGGFVMHDTLYLLKTKSMYSVEDNPSSEPSGWSLHEVSNKVGSIGINSFDAGEEWFLTACRSGIFGFNGGQPVKIMQEIYQIWDAINWFAGNSIVLRNDIDNRKMYCAVPMPTPNQWLPNATLNLGPTSPNVMLVCDYKGLGTFEELVSSAEMHTTMFGALAAVDMKRKWTIYQIPSPYMDFVLQSDGTTNTLYVCNGINSSKIYQFNANQHSDDGVAINSLYTTYGFVNAAKAVTMPIFGMHAKRYSTLQFTAEGSGSMQLKAYPNVLTATYPYIVPGVQQSSGLQASVTLANAENDDFFRPLNIRGQRCFLEFQTNAVGDWFKLHKVLLSGKADAWAPINPTGGGNQGT